MIWRLLFVVVLAACGRSGGVRAVDDLSVARGEFDPISAVNKFGRNASIDAATPEDIWDGGGSWVAPTAARVHNLASSSAEDDADKEPAGTGVYTVQVVGLDANWALAEETVTMDGTSNAATSTAYRRIFRMYALTAGTNDANVGDITATAVTDGTVTAKIAAEMGQTLMAIYTVPADHTLYLRDWYVSINGTSPASAAADVSLFTRDATQSDDVWRTRRLIGVDVDGSSMIHNGWVVPVPIPEKTDVRVYADVTGNGTDISSGFSGHLVNE